jgi:hypothetical protein
MSKQPAGAIKGKPKRLSIRRTRSPSGESGRHDGNEAVESALPPAARARLWSLFEQIEREFEGVYIENLACEYNAL